MQTKGYCLADFENIELCERCGEPASLVAKGVTLCRKCYRNLKKQKNKEEEEE